MSTFFKLSVAGALSISPSTENLDPWQGQSQDCSAALQFTQFGPILPKVFFDISVGSIVESI